MLTSCLRFANCLQTFALLLYECTQIQFTIQVYTKIVYYTSVQKASLLYKYTQNQFIKCIQIWELINGMYIHGQNITTECTGTAFPASACLCLPLPAFCCSCLYLPLPASTWLHLLLPASACFCPPLLASACLCLPKNSILGTHRQTHLTFALLELLLETT